MHSSVEQDTFLGQGEAQFVCARPAKVNCNVCDELRVTHQGELPRDVEVGVKESRLQAVALLAGQRGVGA